LKLSTKKQMLDTVLRRQNKISDEDWHEMIEMVASNVKANSTSFTVELIKYAIKHKITSVLKCFSIDKEVNFNEWLTKSNLDHSNYRFFRHFCPEDYRNAINHSGLKFATLEFYQNLTFEWISVNEITVAMENDLFDAANAKIGDTLTIVARGFNDIETITIQHGNESFLYYEKGVSTGFGDIMYTLKQAIIKNRKEALRNTIPKVKG